MRSNRWLRNARCAATALGLLIASAANANSVQAVCSESALQQLAFPFAADPPISGFPQAALPRCIASTGSVSSQISTDAPPGWGPGGLFFDAGSTITFESPTGFRFGGHAEVGFQNLPPGIGLASYASTMGSFLDLVTIVPPAGISGPGQLVFPMHVTGSASAVGTVVGTGIPHSALFSYDFSTSNASLFGDVADSFGVTTTGETVLCNGVGCAIAPEVFNRTVFISLPFNFGEEFYLKGVFGVSASFFLNAVGAPGFLSGSSTADFSHTVTFGPAQVLDPNGRPIDGVTILSDFDYLAGSASPSPVPEPAPWLVITAALGLVPALRKRARDARLAR